MWCFLEIAAVTVAVDNVIDRGPVALAGHLRGAIGQKLHIAGEDDGHRLVHTAVALGQLGLGLLSDLCDCLTPGNTCEIIAIVSPGIAFPVVGCYNSHCPI